MGCTSSSQRKWDEQDQQPIQPVVNAGPPMHSAVDASMNASDFATMQSTILNSGVQQDPLVHGKINAKQMQLAQQLAFSPEMNAMRSQAMAQAFADPAMQGMLAQMASQMAQTQGQQQQQQQQ
mmetsp:Transcript_20519/g.34338  ORF Transcript_20519/g.34338 Transcript_20519/m.34338 type:complete len:123 (-) Transcript_20519:511-879(-)